MPDTTKRTARLPFPKNVVRLQEILSYILKLPGLVSFQVTGSGIEVTRNVEEDEPPVPLTLLALANETEISAPRVSDLAKVIDIVATTAVPGAHPLTVLMKMTSDVVAATLEPTLWICRRGDWLNSWLGLPASHERDDETLMGIPIVYTTEEDLPQGKLLLLGSLTRIAADAVMGVVAEIGVQA